MRVVHLHQARAQGGLVRVVGALARAQGTRHEVSVVGPLAPSEGDVDLHLLTVTGNRDLRGHLRLAGLLGQLAPDVVFLHAGSPGELALAAAAAERSAAAVVVEHLPTYFPLETKSTRALARWAKRRASAWVSVSADGARFLERSWRLPAGTLDVVLNGVPEPEEREPERGLREALEGRSFVLALGAPQERKGYDVFSGLARRVGPAHPDLAWLWVGAPERGRDGAVTLWPWLEQGIGWLLRRAEALLVPSRAEGCPLVVLEALACATPVLASAVGGIPELVEDDVSGLLAAPGDLEGWGRQLRRLLGDAGLRERLGGAGREAWQERYTAEAMAARHERVMAEAVRRWRERRQ